LFLDNKPLLMFKKPAHAYDFRKKVISAMKSRYLKVTGRGMHSGDALSGNKDISAVDCLVVKLYQEMQLAIDKEEAACHEAAVWKAQKQAVSNILVPPPKLDLPSDPRNLTQQSAPVRNPLSVVTGVINNTNDAPSLEEEMAAIVTPKVAKCQCLMNNDCGDAINKFTEKSSVFYSVFSNYFENKQKLTTAAFCFNC
jgi:hypothetical protein